MSLRKIQVVGFGFLAGFAALAIFAAPSEAASRRARAVAARVSREELPAPAARMAPPIAQPTPGAAPFREYPVGTPPMSAVPVWPAPNCRPYPLDYGAAHGWGVGCYGGKWDPSMPRD